MQIDFKKMTISERRISEIIGELTFEREQLSKVIQFLSTNDYKKETIADLKKTLNKLDSTILSAMKMKEAVRKISSNYREAEKRIETFIDEGIVEKHNFKYCTYMKDNTDFEWSMK